MLGDPDPLSPFSVVGELGEIDTEPATDELPAKEVLLVLLCLF